MKAKRPKPEQFTLAISLVPGPLWGQNLRRKLKQYRWRELRQQMLDKHGLQCSICGDAVDERKRLNLHEQWIYDTGEKPAVARLTGLALICWRCHAVGHFGFTSVRFPDAVPDAIKHFCRVNNVTEEQFRQHEGTALEKWNRRSQLLKWRIDYGRFLPRGRAFSDNFRAYWRDAQECGEDVSTPAPWPFLETEADAYQITLASRRD